MVALLERPREEVLTLEVRGGIREMWGARETEILLEGPAGTGKTRGDLELINLLCHKFPGMRALIVRKHQVTLTTTALVTFNEKVLRPGDGVSFFGGNKYESAAYRYPNGSKIVVGGMDNSEKVLSSEYDIILEVEATELVLEDHEKLITRLRNGVLPYPRVISECNPSARSHWLNKRAEAGMMRRIKTRIQDNPAYFDHAGNATPEGEGYLATLDKLTGSRRQRFLDGEWVGVENAIYSQFDRELHIRPLPEGIRFVDGAIGVDYGENHASAAVAISVDQYGRRWIREVWAEPSVDHGARLKSQIARMRMQYKIAHGRVDPNQGVLAGDVGFEVADRNRYARIKITSRLFNIFPGGVVPAEVTELLDSNPLRTALPMGPFRAEDDSPGLLLVKGAPGIEELADEIEAYHEVFIQTERKEAFDVARIDENCVAAMEYGNEQLAVGHKVDLSKPLPPAGRMARRR